MAAAAAAAVLGGRVLISIRLAGFAQSGPGPVASSVARLIIGVVYVCMLHEALTLDDFNWLLLRHARLQHLHQCLAAIDRRRIGRLADQP